MLAGKDRRYILAIVAVLAHLLGCITSVAAQQAMNRKEILQHIDSLSQRMGTAITEHRYVFKEDNEQLVYLIVEPNAEPDTRWNKEASSEAIFITYLCWKISLTSNRRELYCDQLRATPIPDKRYKIDRLILGKASYEGDCQVGHKSPPSQWMEVGYSDNKNTIEANVLQYYLSHIKK